MQEAAVNPLWDFSVAVYRGEVAQICLALQERCGVDVNLLLYAAWMAVNGRPLSPGHLAEQARAVAEWRERVLLPLRTARRALDGYAPAQALRDELLRLELLAERRQQDMLLAGHRRAEPPVEGASCLADNLLRVVTSAPAATGAGRELALRLAALLARETGVAPPTDG